MSKIQKYAELQNLDDKEFKRHVANFIADAFNVINGNLTFQENFNCQIVQVNFANTNTDQGIATNLNRTGLRYIVIKKNQACDVYDGITQSTKNTVYLRCTQTATVSILLF